MSPARYRAALAVALVTALVALFLRYESARFEATGSDSSCHIAGSAVFDCDAVQTSEYAKVLGVSLATWGVLGAATILCWLLASRREPGFVVMAGIAAAIGACAVLYTATVSWVLLKKICLYCSAMQVGFLALAVLVVPPAWRSRATPLPRRPFLLGGTAFAVLLALALSGEAYAQERARLQRIFEPATKGLRLDVSDTLVLGNPGTSLSVVLFVDFGCPACRECTKKAAELVKKYPTCVHFRLKHFPLDNECNKQLPRAWHPNACRAALAAQAAHEFGKDAEAVPLVFEHQDDGFGKAVLARIGQELGMPAERWADELAAADVEAIRDRDIAEGNALGLRQVPVAFVNGQWVDASRLEETVSKLCSR